MTVKIPHTADTVEILSSIPSGEKQTARQLYEHMRDVQYEAGTSQCEVTFHDIESHADMDHVLAEICVAAEQRGKWPVLHLESHGDPTGITLANREFVSWAELNPLMLRLNRATRNHLLVMVAACWGFAGIKALVSDIDHGAAFRILGGPSGEISSGEIEDAMKAFYAKLLRGGNLVECMQAAQLREPTFRLYSAEEAFRSGWLVAMKAFPRTNKEVQAHAENIVSALKQSPGGDQVERPHRLAKDLIRARDFNQAFQNYKTAFFMLSDFPEVAAETEGVTLPSE